MFSYRARKLAWLSVVLSIPLLGYFRAISIYHAQDSSSSSLTSFLVARLSRSCSTDTSLSQIPHELDAGAWWEIDDLIGERYWEVNNLVVERHCEVNSLVVEM